VHITVIELTITPVLCYVGFSSRQQLPLLSLDQAEIRCRLEEKVTQIVAPPAADSVTRMCYNTTSFRPSSVFRQHMADDGAGRKVGNVSLTQIY